MTRNFVVLVALLFLSSLFVEGVDRSKFKRCDQSSFCKRNRRLSDPEAKLDTYSIIPGSLSKTDSHLSGRIQTPHTQLILEIRTYQRNIVRLQVLESNELRYTGPQEVLLPNLEEKGFKEVSNSDAKYEFSLGEITGVIGLSPFTLDFYDGDEHIIAVNQRNLFHFEHLIDGKSNDFVPQKISNAEATKPDTWNDESDGVWEAPLKENPEMEGRWEESYGGHQDHKPKGPESVGLDFSFVGSTNVYGLPEHATDLKLKPTRGEGAYADPYRLYNLDVFEYELNNEMALYGAVPLMVSHTSKRTSGIFWLNAAETWVDVVEKEGSTLSHWFSESGIIDVFFLFGPSPADLFGQYAFLTGTTPLPPLFSLGYHQCKWNYKSEKEVDEVDQAFDASNIPYDVLWLDIEHTDGKRYFTWDSMNFPTPKVMQKKIDDKGRKMVTIVDPHIKRDTHYKVHTEASSNGLYVKNHDGGEYEGHCWPGGSSWIDYSDPKAREWWAQRFTYDNYDGSTDILFTWNDMNEPSVFNGPETTMHKDAYHHNGVEHRNIHNIYGMYMQMATYEGLVERNSGHNERPFLLVRSFFAGSQRYGAVWTGDNRGAWDHLQIAQPMLLSLGLGGITFSGADVGGFFGNPETELLTRWYQAGAFHPFFRAHGHLDSKRREPFLFDEPHQSIMRESIRTRYAYLPYWYTTFFNHSLSGIPVMRPLWVEYPTEERFFREQDQFLIGRDLLVKPVTAAGVTSLEIQFPGSQPWYDVITGEKYDGSTQVEVAAPLEKIPVFQRGGSIIPKQERPRRSTKAMAADPYTLIVAVNSQKEAEGELYLDDGHSFDYLRGNYLRRSFQFKNNQLTSSSLGEGQFVAPNTIERVVFMGLSGAPSKASLKTSDGQEVSLEFSFGENRLTLRKPNMSIGADWTITLFP